MSRDPPGFCQSSGDSSPLSVTNPYPSEMWRTNWSHSPAYRLNFEAPRDSVRCNFMAMWPTTDLRTKKRDCRDAIVATSRTQGGRGDGVTKSRWALALAGLLKPPSASQVRVPRTPAYVALAFRSEHYLRQHPRGSNEREPTSGGVNEFVESTHFVVAVAEIIEIQITSGYDCILKIVQDKLCRRIKIRVENRDEHLMRRNPVGG